MPETPVTKNAVYSAIPTIQVDGQFNNAIANQLLGMEMREQEGGMSALELRFSNIGPSNNGSQDTVFEDGKVLKLGTQLKLFAGDVDSPTEIFRGKVTAIEGRFPRQGPPELVVLSEDSLQAARMHRRTKTWDVSTLGDIVTQIANDLSLTPQVNGLDASVGTEQQLNETDLAFLRRLLARYDADVQIVADELHASPRSQVQRTSLQLEMNSQLRNVRVLADLAHQATQVTVTGWDFQQGQTISATSQSTDFGQGSGQTGKDWIAQALSSRSEQIANYASMNQSEAQSLADADFLQRSRRFVVAHGSTEGNASLRVGTWLTLSGLGPRFSNDYYVTSAIHRWDTNNGYETEFTAESAYLGNAS
jgi:phage protein D